MKLISDDARHWWKLLSVQVAVLAAAADVLQDHVDYLKEILPEGWTRYVFVLIVLARLVHQTLDASESGHMGHSFRDYDGRVPDILDDGRSGGKGKDKGAE